jgi:hypothetical protein
MFVYHHPVRVIHELDVHASHLVTEALSDRSGEMKMRGLSRKFAPNLSSRPGTPIGLLPVAHLAVKRQGVLGISGTGNQYELPKLPSPNAGMLCDGKRDIKGGVETAGKDIGSWFRDREFPDVQTLGMGVMLET